MTISVTKISMLPDAPAPISGTDLVVLVQNGVTCQSTITATAAAGSPDVINVANLVPIVGDGVTDNGDAFDSFNLIGKTLGGQTFPTVVTISIAASAVISWTSHLLRVNDALMFTTTGQLPTGISSGVVYYVISAGMTPDSFQISTKNYYFDPNIGHLTGEGSPVGTSGSQSGTQSVRVLGAMWQNLMIPPGAYVAGSARLGANQRKMRVLAYGVQTDTLNLGPFNLGINNDFEYNVFAYINTAIANSSTVTVTTLGDATLFVPNQWICVGALDLQSTFGSSSGFPPNNYYAEYRRIVSINTGSGVITLDEPLRHTYRSTYPKFFTGNAPTGHGTGDVAYGGAAIIWGMNSDWDKEIEINGIEYKDTGFENTAAGARSVRFIDCTVNGLGGFTPTISKFYSIDNCYCPVGSVSGAGRIEVDKMVEHIVIRNSYLPSGSLELQSSSPNYLVVENCAMQEITGTAKNTEIRNSDINTLTVGPLAFGTSETLTIVNSRITVFQRTLQIADQLIASSNQSQCVHNFTFVNGTLKQPIASTKANHWAVPGRSMYVNDMIQNFTSMGSPFQVLDVYVSSSNFCIDTTLTAMPVGNSTSSTVTITIATPGVVTWTSNGLSNGTPIVLETTGALPTGLSPGGIVYYVVNVATNSFQLSSTVSGPAINTSGSQSGTHTAYSNPLHFSTHPCPRVTVIGSSGCSAIEDVSNGPANMPLFSYAKRRTVGPLEITQNLITPLKVMGTLVSLKINVIRAYNGATDPYNLTISGIAFNSSLIESDLSEIIDLKTAGLRTITPTTATGPGGSADTIAAFANWLSGDGVYYLANTLAPVETFQHFPIVEIEIITDQGLIDPAVISFLGPTQAHEEIIADTTTFGTGL